MSTYPERRVHRDLDVDTLARVYTFASPALSAGDVVEFGSPAWVELPIDAPEKLYAIIRAAMAWWSGMALGVEIPEDVIHREIQRRLTGTSKDVAEADWETLNRFHSQAQRVRQYRATPYGGTAA